MSRISITDDEVIKFRKALEALTDDAQENGTLGACAVALAYSLNSLLQRYTPTHVGLEYVHPTQELMEGVAGVVGGDRSLRTQKKLIAGFTALMGTYRRRVEVSSQEPPKFN